MNIVILKSHSLPSSNLTQCTPALKLPSMIMRHEKLGVLAWHDCSRIAGANMKFANIWPFVRALGFFTTEPVEAAKLMLGRSDRCEPTVARSITRPFSPFFL
ncbi:hypothetical protein AG1IA_03070 [Rhizoctonia solani AG-1 IA]|uniref:Uncharacterized protein n=1 Tax=Thanatephorus cucumeris (strain AG1-IA) TaxID=983506 RepID=L8WXV2_THACA|nr:hypothetical protein AG1IA_03070 [Rhizoctonia solani AG-1 IA]